MASLRKRRTRRGFVYVVDFTFRGRRHVISTKTHDHKTARRILEDIQGQIARGTFNLDQYEKKHARLSGFFEEYFKYAEGYKKTNTILNERNYTKKFLAFVGDRDVRSIDARMLDQWKAATIKTVSPTTFNIERRTLQAIFSLAVKWGYMDKNPFREISKVKVEQKRLFLTDEELTRVFRLIDEDTSAADSERRRDYNRKFLLFVDFLLHTGLRREESIGLRKENVDLSRGILFVEKTKSKTFRMVPLNRRAKEILEQLGDDLFNNVRGSSVSHKFGRYLEKAGLSGWKLHSLRHTFATRLASMGVDIYTISLLLGHSDIRTSAIYAKATIEALQSAVAKLPTHENLTERYPTTEPSRSLNTDIPP